jgi:hypothetical protein
VLLIVTGFSINDIYSLRREIDDAASIHFTFCKKLPRLPILLPLGPFYLKSNPELPVVFPGRRRRPSPSAATLRRPNPPCLTIRSFLRSTRSFASFSPRPLDQELRRWDVEEELRLRYTRSSGGGEHRRRSAGGQSLHPPAGLCRRRRRGRPGSYLSGRCSRQHLMLPRRSTSSCIFSTRIPPAAPAP